MGCPNLSGLDDSEESCLGRVVIEGFVRLTRQHVVQNVSLFRLHLRTTILLVQIPSDAAFSCLGPLRPEQGPRQANAFAFGTDPTPFVSPPCMRRFGPLFCTDEVCSSNSFNLVLIVKTVSVEISHAFALEAWRFPTLVRGDFPRFSRSYRKSVEISTGLYEVVTNAPHSPEE